MRKAFLVALAIAAPIVVGLGSRKRRELKGIALLGDSLAVGIRAPLEALARDAGVPFYADATVGASVVDFPESRLAGVPSGYAIAVSLGGNDRMRTWDPPVAHEIERFARAPRDVWWIDMDFPTIEDRAGTVDAWKRSASHVIDARAAEPWHRASDGVHLTMDEYRRLAALVFARLRA